MSRNLINSECEIHKKVCEYICVYSKCAKRLICQKCRSQHLDIHPAQFIYEVENLAQIHSYNKVDKLKQILVKEKVTQEAIMKDIYKEFETITNAFNQKINSFAKESRALMEAELTNYLRANKFLIDQTQNQIKKSSTKSVINKPNKMLQETIHEAELVNRRENLILQNGQSYKWYADTTREMVAGVILEIKAMTKVVIKMINNSLGLQRNKYSTEYIKQQDHHQMSFMKRYHASNEVAFDRAKLQSDVLHQKKTLQYKDAEINKNRKEIKDKVVQIAELQEKIEGLTEELLGWQQKKEREEREKRLLIERQRKMKEEMLIKSGIIGSNGRSLCFDRKKVDEKLFPLIMQLVPHPIMLDISNHELTNQQLDMLLNCTSIQILKYNFSKLDQTVIFKFLKAYSNLKHLQLNSCQIGDQMLYGISRHFTPRLKILYLIDNHISDDGLEQMFSHMTLFLQALYISYNRVTFKTIETLHKYASELRVLHISKTLIQNKGGFFIGRYMKSLEQLYIGSTGMTKEGFLSISRNCVKLKRLSVVANEISTEVVTQILLGLKDLQWLDLSYCKLQRGDIEKIQKLKIFNKDLNIIFGL